ncbi:elongation factor 4 [Candidatus Gottesmanbacteria bacterium]|nr:elongation factor 4 [Candidatus Gottesmanbacteria bacterium]
MASFDNAQDKQSHIRNFCVIAHIDHGKSTLCDRLMEMTGTVARRDMQAQLLDSNPIERERGITIKLAPVRMRYEASMHDAYILNLIDTPGHVDFAYEVSRSLAACEGALLVVDAGQGVQAQTLANLRLARENNLTVIPIINKIDLPNARIAETLESLELLGFTKEEVLQISAKTGENVGKVLDAIVERIPEPQGVPGEPLRALVFSSQYDIHKGVVVFVRVVDGSIQWQPDISLRFMASGAEVTPIEVGYFAPKMVHSAGLLCGEVGYIATGLKDIRVAKVGDTITEARSSITPLAGYEEPKPMVFLGLFPINSDEITQAREAMERLRLSDSAFSFRPISSLALGNGFHCGFLGLLHAEIVQERLSREFGLNMLATAPNVEYRIKLKDAGNKSIKVIQSASEFPDPSVIAEAMEPMMSVTIFSPSKYIGAIMQLVQEKRGEQTNMTYVADQVELEYLLPLSEMIVDFFDRLKSVTEGYATLDYTFFDFQAAEVVKVDVLVNKDRVDAFSFLTVSANAQKRSRELVERLAAAIPRSQFEIPIQTAIGGTVIARADVKGFRKDVTKKLYGGDRTRKDKLLDKQKKGKAKMKRIGRVDIPQDAFFTVLKRD